MEELIKLIIKPIIALVVIALVLSGGYLLIRCSDGVQEFLRKSSFGTKLVELIDPSPVYCAQTRFLYSTDGGTTYTETIQELPIKKTYYLTIEMQVAQSRKTDEEQVVVATVTIPSTEVLDCYLGDHPGESITGYYDAVKGETYYRFNIVASTSPSKFRVTFECKPLTEGRATFTVKYSEPLSSNWNQTESIKYVKQ